MVFFWDRCLTFNPRRQEEKKVARRNMNEGGQRTPPPSIFKSIQPIDMKVQVCVISVQCTSN